MKYQVVIFSALVALTAAFPTSKSTVQKRGVAYTPLVQYPANVHYIAQPQYHHAITKVQAPVINYAQPAVVAKVRPIPIAILRHSADSGIDGSFSYDFDTENGISARANGLVKNLGTKEETQVMQGSYSYTGPDGIPISTNWIADEFGFRVEGAHLPTPPPIPEAIARSIEYNRAHPQPVGVEFN